MTSSNISFPTGQPQVILVPMNLTNAALFVVSAVALLGTPGPGIASLVAIGKRRGFAGSLRFFAGLQVGLAIVAGACASGLLSVLTSIPALTSALTLAAIAYLGWLAWSIATGPIGAAAQAAPAATNFPAGLLLGLSNPKAYLSFVTLFASQMLVSGSRSADALSKWGLTVTVILTVDIAWLYAGVRLGQISLSARAERLVNVALGLTILAVAAYALSDWNLNPKPSTATLSGQLPTLPAARAGQAILPS